MHTQFLTDIRHGNMDFVKGAADGQVDKIIDQAGKFNLFVQFIYAQYMAFEN